MLKYMGPDVHLYGAWASTASVSRVKSPFFDIAMTAAVVAYGVVLFVLLKVRQHGTIRWVLRVWCVTNVCLPALHLRVVRLSPS
jgi:hypothetical protein